MIQAMADKVNDGVDRAGRALDSLPHSNRLMGAAIGLPSALVIGIARWLTPSEKGYGTHLQLGLGECTMLHLTGYPCPMCGMTTTFTLFAHMRFVDAVVNQPFGLVLFWSTFAMAVIGIFDLVTNRGLWRRALAVVTRYETFTAGVLLVGMFLGWVYKVLMMHPELAFWR